MTDELEVWLDDPLVGAEPCVVGRLFRSAARGREVTRFCYTSEWLAESSAAFALDPELPLAPGDFFPRSGRGLHGVFRDSAPDRWGRVLMERREADEARRAGRRPRTLGEWEFLTGVNDTGRLGALRLREPGTGRWLDDRAPGIPPAARLRELEAVARALEEGARPGEEVETDWLRLIVAPGSSLGGARPKASYLDEEGALWLAKFPAKDDRRDVGALEFFTHELARAAGVEVPDARLERFLGPYRTFCARRFDRVGGRRRTFASAMTLLSREDGEPASYLELAEALQLLGDAARLEADLRQLYRRIVFSVLVGNRDDHLRNHGFLRGPTGWQLAPAFDLNPTPERSEHALALDGSDARPELATLRATARFYRLREREAARIEAEVRAALAPWRRLAQRLGLARDEVELLAAVLSSAGE